MFSRMGKTEVNYNIEHALTITKISLNEEVPNRKENKMNFYSVATDT